MTRREEMIRLTCAFIARGEGPVGAVSLAGSSIDMVDKVEEERAEEAKLTEEEREAIRLKEEEEEERRARRRQCPWCLGEGWDTVGYERARRKCPQCGGTGYKPEEEEKKDA